ncbi:hypothetical protein [Streptomyces sp. NPDC058964]|uniref:hypothetical protein n=1 Tax=Streptomyces sp. NPDC058964 TaxID=3346681 RepID=UPI0036AA67D8
MNYKLAKGIQFRPLSIKGRFLAFTTTPPTVLQVDAGSVLLLKLYERGLTGDELVARYAELRKKSDADARRELARRADGLAGAGLLEQLPARPRRLTRSEQGISAREEV